MLLKLFVSHVLKIHTEMKEQGHAMDAPTQ